MDPVDSTCRNGTTLICQENPVALVENWPALGIYIEDDTCSSPSLVLAAKSNCNSMEYEGNLYSTQVSCATSTLSIRAYNTSLTCEGNPVVDESMTVDSCVVTTDFLTTLPDNLPDNLQQYADLIDITSASYYADCGGATQLPGIDGGSPTNDDTTDTTKSSSSSNNAAKFGGLGIGGLSGILIGIIATGLFVAFVANKVIFKKKPEDTQNML